VKVGGERTEICEERCSAGMPNKAGKKRGKIRIEGRFAQEEGEKNSNQAITRLGVGTLPALKVDLKITKEFRAEREDISTMVAS